MKKSVFKRIWLRFIAVGVLFAALCTAVPLETVAASKNAKQYFERGKTHFEKQRFNKAARAFRQAYELKPSWKLLYNIAQSEAASKRYGLAVEAFERYLVEGGDDIEVARRDEVIEELRRMREMVGSVLFDSPDDCAVMIDGFRRGKTPLAGPLLVAAGIEHALKVSCPNRKVHEQPILTYGGSSVEVVIEPEESVTDQKTESDPASGSVAPQNNKNAQILKTVGLITAGVGVAAVAGGTVMGVRALGQGKDLEAQCPNNQCSKDKQSGIDKMETSGKISTVLFSVGAALAVTGVILTAVGVQKTEHPGLALGPNGMSYTWSF